MKALVKYGTEAGQASLREVSVAEPGDRQVLLKVSGCGICGSDLHAFAASPGYEWVRPPVILGHEFAGTVVACGPGADRYCPGERVAVMGIQGCGRCGACREGCSNLCDSRRVIGLNMDGGMAEFAVVDEAWLVSVPPSLHPVMAALTEPFSVAVHALSKVRIDPEARVVISGPGPIGLFAGIIARLKGARVLVTGIDADIERRFPAARALGLDIATVAADGLDKALERFFKGGAADLWVETSGAGEALKAAAGRVRRGGDIVIVAMYRQEFSFNPTISVRGSQNWHFSYASAWKDYRFALDLMTGGRVDLAPLVDFFPLYRAEEAFEAARLGKTVKAILVPAC
jgi:L-iditol 2-dehydrogenase